MVNSEKFAKRLQKIMDYHDLSAAAFADSIEVGRSSISHILSGRNKPGLDFVLKITSAYPEVDLYWLLNGKGNFPKEKVPGMEVAIPSPTSNTDKLEETGKKAHSGKTLKKIVWFYEDGTFEVFNSGV
jgi:transcriptional regulator with XRE-family HTH domain